MTKKHLKKNEKAESAGKYAPVNGLSLYYEIHGSGNPLVLLHGGGSTIHSTFSRILPKLAEKHKIIALELQAHGHTADIDRPLSFEHDADDTAGLLRHLGVEKADFMGFSNGGTTCLQIALRHPELVGKLVLASAAFKRDGMQSGLFEGLGSASIDSMPEPLKEEYLRANPDPEGLQNMFNRDVARMLIFKDISDDDIKSIKAPALVINGDADVIRAEHALELAGLLQDARLAILPSGHGDYIGETCSNNGNSSMPDFVIEMIEEFLGH